MIRNRDTVKYWKRQQLYFIKTMKKPTLLDEARAIRARAERTRRLAKATIDADATKAIMAYAEDLERRATNLEFKARELQVEDGPGRQQDGEFAQELRQEIELTRATVSEIQHSLGDKADGDEPR
jgi:predicted  nucleic acid-binding Zn-ribbon protein